MIHKIYFKSALFGMLLLMLFLVDLFWDVASYVHTEKIESVLNNAGSLAPVLYTCIMALAVIISPIPSLPLDIAAGAVFGPFLGTVYSVIGALVGAMISFMIARSLGRGILERYLGGHINFCAVCSDKLLTKIVFFSRLLPVISFDVVSYGAGLTKMSLKKFTLATFLGMIPLTFVYNYFGSVLVFGSGVTLVLGLIMVLLFFLIPRWAEKRDLFATKRFFSHNESRRMK